MSPCGPTLEEQLEYTLHLGVLFVHQHGWCERRMIVKIKFVLPVAMVISVWLILLIMLALKCLVLFWKCTMTRALLKHKDYLYRFILEWFTSSSWQTGVRNAQISSDSQYNYSIGKTGDSKQQIVWVLSSWPPHIFKRGRRSGATSQMDTYCIPLCKLLI